MDIYSFIIAVLHMPFILSKVFGFRLVGLTGGIATGKSTATKYLKQLGIPVIDFDLISKEIVQPGSKTLDEIAKIFGSDVINHDKTLNRDKLSSLIFSDKKKRHLLDKIMMKPIMYRFLYIIIVWFFLGLSKQYKGKRGHNNHGIMTSKLYPGLEQPFSGPKIIVLDCPLLFESGISSICSSTLYIDSDENIQLQRLMSRNNLTQDVALSKIKAQYNRAEKRKRATYIIDNNTTHDVLYTQLNKWFPQISSSFGIPLPTPKPYPQIKHLLLPDLRSPSSSSSPSSPSVSSPSHSQDSPNNSPQQQQQQHGEQGQHYNLIPPEGIDPQLLIDETTMPSLLSRYMPLSLYMNLPSVLSCGITIVVSLTAWFVIPLAENAIFGTNTTAHIIGKK